jgi:hypothetical protein
MRTHATSQSFRRIWASVYCRPRSCSSPVSTCCGHHRATLRFISPAGRVAMGRRTRHAAQRRRALVHAAHAVSAARHPGRGACQCVESRELSRAGVHGFTLPSWIAASCADARGVAALGPRIKRRRARKVSPLRVSCCTPRPECSSTQCLIRSTRTPVNACSILSPRTLSTPGSSILGARRHAIRSSRASCISSKIRRYAGSPAKRHLPCVSNQRRGDPRRTDELNAGHTGRGAGAPHGLPRAELRMHSASPALTCARPPTVAFRPRPLCHPCSGSAHSAH